MTPLAQRICHELTLPMADRRLKAPEGGTERMFDAHCFELSEVIEVFKLLVDNVSKGIQIGGRMERLMFLPAPVTWIEWRDSAGGRTGFRMDDLGNGYAEVWASCIGSLDVPYLLKLAQLPLLGTKFFGETDDPPIHLFGDFGVEWFAQMIGEVMGAMALINTPRVIGRRQHMPHAGLQRRIARSKGMVGKFPLHAWTEIKLEVTPPKLDRGEPRETRLTGAKALHFCRCHLRVRLGQLELVSAHWRGDPALGMKQSRYVLTPPKHPPEVHP